MLLFCLYVCATPQFLVPAENRSRYCIPRNGIIDGCEIWCVCRELNQCTMEKQPPLIHLTRHNRLDFLFAFFALTYSISNGLDSHRFDWVTVQDDQEIGFSRLANVVNYKHTPLCLLLFVVLFFKTGLLCVVLSVLEVKLHAQLCTSAGIKGMYRHCSIFSFFV